MARKPRIEYEGALYHVTTRGNHRQKIFRDRGDFVKYLGILTHYKAQYDFYLYAYVLMNNHVHLLMETQKSPLSKILQGINQRYTLYFNWKYGTVGHLFQGRYKAFICDRDQYLLSLIKYIHLNPVRAQMSKTPGEYRWSSHRGYMGRDEHGLVDVNRVLKIFSENTSKARDLYRTYMSDGSVLRKEEVYHSVAQNILGSDEFVERITKRGEGIERKQRGRKEYSLIEIAGEVVRRFGINVEQLRGEDRTGRVSSGRKMMALIAERYGYRRQEIAEFIQKDPAVVTRYLREKPGLNEEVETIIKILSEKANVKNQA
jgi:REP element-mobilizing transposase RayT